MYSPHTPNLKPQAPTPNPQATRDHPEQVKGGVRRVDQDHRSRRQACAAYSIRIVLRYPDSLITDPDSLITHPDGLTMTAGDPRSPGASQGGVSPCGSRPPLSPSGSSSLSNRLQWAPGFPKVHRRVCAPPPQVDAEMLKVNRRCVPTRGGPWPF
jgi:hypothetical protein